MTADIVKDLSAEYGIAEVANAVAFMVGIYSLALGVLGLGFLLDYVSVPVLTGFISATALIIGMGQVGNLVGLSDVPDGVFNIIGDVLKRLPHWDGPTCGIGFGTVVLLICLEQVGKRWGKKHFLIKYISSSRAVIALVIFTLISYLVNKDRGSNVLWAISKVNTHGIIAPKAHNTSLISKVATRALAPLVACTLEHLAVGKAFGRRNGYTIDQSQEFNYLGVTNIINSFFGAMPVGGAMSRTAVNSECGVKSPLNGLVTAGFILLTIYVFSPALYWLPKSTLSAIIVSSFLLKHPNTANVSLRLWRSFISSDQFRFFTSSGEFLLPILSLRCFVFGLPYLSRRKLELKLVLVSVLRGQCCVMPSPSLLCVPIQWKPLPLRMLHQQEALTALTVVALSLPVLIFQAIAY